MYHMSRLGVFCCSTDYYQHKIDQHLLARFKATAKENRHSVQPTGYEEDNCRADTNICNTRLPCRSVFLIITALVFFFDSRTAQQKLDQISFSNDSQQRYFKCREL